MSCWTRISWIHEYAKSCCRIVKPPTNRNSSTILHVSRFSRQKRNDSNAINTRNRLQINQLWIHIAWKRIYFGFCSMCKCTVMLLVVSCRRANGPNIFSQPAYGGMITSLWRQNDIATSFWRDIDVIITTRVGWVLLVLCFFLSSYFFPIFLFSFYLRSFIFYFKNCSI